MAAVSGRRNYTVFPHYRARSVLTRQKEEGEGQDPGSERFPRREKRLRRRQRTIGLDIELGRRSRRLATRE